MERDPAQSHSCAESKTPLGVEIRIVATGGRGVDGVGWEVWTCWPKGTGLQLDGGVKVNVLMSIVSEYCC